VVYLRLTTQALDVLSARTPQLKIALLENQARDLAS